MLYTFFCIMLAASPAAAGDRITTITIATENWDDATEKDGSGIYWDILNQIYQPEKIQIKRINTTYAGAVRLLKTKKTDALIGAYPDEINDAIYPKHHFAADIVHVVAKKGRIKNWPGEAMLKGRKTGWVKGYAYDEYLSVPVQKVEVYDRMAGLRILKYGRIDFFIDSAGDLQDVFKKKKYLRQDFDEWFLKKLKIYVVFTENERGRKLADIFDKRFEALLKTGKISNLYDYYINEKGANLTNPFSSEPFNAGQERD